MIIERQVDIAAPPETVWPILIDVRRWPEWTPSVKSVRPLDGEPLRVRSRVRVRQPRLPTAVWTVTDLDPERYFEWRSITPGLVSVAGHRLEPSAGGTRVTLSISWNGPLANVISFLFGKLSSRYVEMEALGLKQRAESGRPPL